MQGSYRQKLSGKTSTYIQYTGVVIFSTLVFISIPGFFFDDAGFVLRYLDNFQQGYLFRYNINDGPVYGISGYLHGCLTGFLCFIRLTTPEQALWVSNYTGFVLSSCFLLGIFRTLVKPGRKAVLCWLIGITTCKMYISVARCGLETPLHISLMMGAVYFLLSNRVKTFYVFTALFITSKLDAVPVAVVLLGLSFIKQWFGEQGNRNIKTILLNFSSWFLVPLTLGLGSIYYIFGSILPQSAYAKLYYHGHPDDSWFPFLEYFTNNALRLFLTASVLVFACIHLGEVIAKRKITLGIHFIFGLMFLAVMAMYYWYNPGEKMMWYYAMPEMLLYLQVIYSSYYFTHAWFQKKLFRLTWMGGISLLAVALWITVFNGMRFLDHSIRPVENERTLLGKLVADMSNKDDILLSYHGLIARPFKGYVLDGSGLNSKVVTDLKRDEDLIIKDYSPDFIVNHAFESSIKNYNHFNYELVGVYRDVSRRGYKPWIVLKKAIGKMHKLKLVDPGNIKGSEFYMDVVHIKPVHDKIIIGNGNSPLYRVYLHIGTGREKIPWNLNAVIFQKGVKKENDLLVPALNNSGEHLSQYVYDLKIDLTGADSVILSSTKPDWEITDPVFELVER